MQNQRCHRIWWPSRGYFRPVMKLRSEYIRRANQTPRIHRGSPHPPTLQTLTPQATWIQIQIRVRATTQTEITTRPKTELISRLFYSREWGRQTEFRDRETCSWFVSRNKGNRRPAEGNRNKREAWAVRCLGIRETWSWLLVELRGRESLAGSITVDPFYIPHAPLRWVFAPVM